MSARALLAFELATSPVLTSVVVKAIKSGRPVSSIFKLAPLRRAHHSAQRNGWMYTFKHRGGNVETER